MGQVECYELTLTPDYVSDWAFADAVRELIQNGTDQEILEATNQFSLSYDGKSKKLTLRNAKSKLNINTLLLGRSTKAKNDDTVGQFGEGYKIAALVLNRLGKIFTIYNNEKNEIWNSHFKNSSKWKERILAFYISKNDANETGLNIVIGNIEREEYNSLYDVWLGLDTYKKITTTYGEILTEEAHKGEIYVNGLRVGCNVKMEYGYNFKPRYIKLERDRKTCDTWNAQVITAKMISEAMVNGDIEMEVVRKMIERDSNDVYNMDTFTVDNKEVKAMLIEAFDNQNAPLSVPVSTQDEIKKVRAYGGNPVVVPTRVASLLKEETKNRIKELLSVPALKQLTLKEEFERWLGIYEGKLESEAVEEFKKLTEKL